MDPSEFQDGVSQAAAYDPLSLANPWVWITGAILIFLIGFLMHHYGARTAEAREREDRRKVIDRIYSRINEKARTAAAAPRHQLTTAAHALADEIRNLLGPVVALTPFGVRAVALERALAGRPTHHTHVEDHADDSDDHSSTETGAGHGPGGASPQSSAASQINISIGGDAGAHGAGHGAGHGSGTASLDPIRAAVTAICDYWSRTSMKAELAAAQAALLRMPPEAPKSPGSGH